MNTPNENESVFDLLVRDETQTGECKCCEINAEKCRQLETQVQELREALAQYAGNRIDLTDASCHKGLTTPEKCGRCGRDLKAWDLLDKTK